MRVFIVEAQMTIAMMIEEMLVDPGHELLERRCACRTLCLPPHRFTQMRQCLTYLEGPMSFPVADILLERLIPFILATFSGRIGIAYEGAPVLSKPFIWMPPFARRGRQLHPEGKLDDPTVFAKRDRYPSPLFVSLKRAALTSSFHSTRPSSTARSPVFSPTPLGGELYSVSFKPFNRIRSLAFFIGGMMARQLRLACAYATPR